MFSRVFRNVMSRRRYSLDWKLSRVDWKTKESRGPVPATVPGGAQLDWAKANGLPDYRFGTNVRQWKDLEDSGWLYRGVSAEPLDRGPEERIFLVVQGVDYACDVSIGGRPLGHHRGLQTSFREDVTSFWRPGAAIDVLVHPAPKAHATPEDRTQARTSCKPAVAYGWDFHPRLIPLGLWREAFLETRPAVHFQNPPAVRYALSADCSSVEGRVEVRLNVPAPEDAVVCWELRDAGGGIVCSEEMRVPTGQRQLAIPFAMPSVDLWWPHDQGAPALYSSRTELRVGATQDEASCFVGFRRIRLVMAPGQWENPGHFPKSRSHPPMTLEVNGRRIFAKGANWVCPDVFPGTLTPRCYEEQLLLVRESHMNILRVWGGSTAPGDVFFDLCDRLGILVWQEFPLSCNDYPDEEDYLAQLDQESRSLIERLSPHPSLALWCGGNELFNAWSRMTDQSLALRLLNRNCYELDPNRPFLPTAPLEGMAHGHYVFRDPETGEEAWAMFQRSACTAYSEFGCPAPASVETLKAILPAEELWPPGAGEAWETHHAFAAWSPESWLHLSQIERYFGSPKTLEELVERGQLLQAAGYQGLFEEVRRQKPVASMALNWCLNEPWPSAANNSLISWPCQPKPALKAVAKACRPTLASARISKFSWMPGENFDPEVWILHDGAHPLEPANVTAWLECGGIRHSLVTWNSGAIPPNTNRRGPRAQCLLPEFPERIFFLHLEVGGHPEWNSAYTLVKSAASATALSENTTRPLNL